MKSVKRTLSLALAFVMAFGLTIAGLPGASAVISSVDVGQGTAVGTVTITVRDATGSAQHYVFDTAAKTAGDFDASMPAVAGAGDIAFDPAKPVLTVFDVNIDGVGGVGVFSVTVNPDTQVKKPDAPTVTAGQTLSVGAAVAGAGLPTDSAAFELFAFTGATPDFAAANKLTLGTANSATLPGTLTASGSYRLAVRHITSGAWAVSANQFALSSASPKAKLSFYPQATKGFALKAAKPGDKIFIRAEFTEVMDTAAAKLPTVEVKGAFATAAMTMTSVNTTDFNCEWTIPSGTTTVTLDESNFAITGVDTRGVPAEVRPSQVASFTVDGEKPRVTKVDPADEDIGIRLKSNLEIRFSEPVDTDYGKVTLTAGASVVAPVWNDDNTIVTYQFNSLKARVQYTMTIEDFRDIAGNQISTVTTWFATVQTETAGDASSSTGSTATGTSTGQTSQLATTVPQVSPQVVAINMALETALTGDTASATVTEAVIKDAGGRAKVAEARGEVATVFLNMKLTPEIKNAKAVIPAALLESFITDSKASLCFNADTIGRITLSRDMIEALQAASGGSDIAFTMTRADISGTSSEFALRSGVDFTVMAGDKAITALDGGNFRVGIPYAPTAAELASPESLILCGVSASGVEILRGGYSATDRVVTGYTPHLSVYTVGYRPISFSDVPYSAWFRPAVTYIAARSITTEKGTFAPDRNITRAEFVAMLMRAYRIDISNPPADNFSDASGWSAPYLAVAKKLGIVNGVGGDRFAPNSNLTREQMFAMVHRALTALGEMPAYSRGPALETFSDGAQVGEAYKSAADALVRHGIVKGSGNTLSPKSFTTRAQMAAVFYELLK